MWKAFGRGFDSRRLHHFFLLILFGTTLFAQNEGIQVFEGTHKSHIPIQTIEGSPYIRLTELQPLFNLELKPLAGNQNLSIVLGQHNVILSANRALVSLDEKLVYLNQPVYVAQGDWYIPLDFIPKVLKATTDKRLLWLENSHSLILGDVLPNQVTMKYSFQEDRSRLVFQSVRPVGYSLKLQGSKLIIKPDSEDFSPAFQNTPFEDGLLKQLTIEVTGERKTFQIQMDSEVASYKSFDLSDPPRFVIDFYRKTATAETTENVEKPSEEKQAPPTILPSTNPSGWVVVIDPGHGGSETGAKGPDGTMEKDIVLSIAHRLKSMLENNTPIRVILTRNGDDLVPLDNRTAIANNNKANLFISIHANATIYGRAKGAETYFLSSQATDNEARNIAAVENNAIGLNQELPNIDNELKLILWDMAQTEYLAESSQLAETIQQELNGALAIANRGIKQAPFRVLMGAMMPAVLVEVGFINNPEEEKLMKNTEYQNKIARALFLSIRKIQSMEEAQATQLQQSSH